MEGRRRPPFVGRRAIPATDRPPRRRRKTTTRCLAQEGDMNSDQRFAMCSIAAIMIFALAGGIGVMSAMPNVPVGAIVLSEISAFACVVAFTLLIWAAIQDGKQPDRAAVE